MPIAGLYPPRHSADSGYLFIYSQLTTHYHLPPFTRPLMNPLLQQIRTKASSLNKHILLPDALDERAISAARIIANEKIARASGSSDPRQRSPPKRPR